jgi:hypothetical protein
MDIPRKMSNEESKFVAGVIVTERALAIANANHNIAKVQLEKYHERRAKSL